MILARAVEGDQLNNFEERYNRIISSKDSDYQKQVDLERLKTDMEFVLGIPLLPDDRFEEDHPDVMKLFRKIKREMV